MVTPLHSSWELLLVLLAVLCCIGKADLAVDSEGEAANCPGCCEEALQVTMLQTSLRTSFGLPQPSGTSALHWNGTTAERWPSRGHLAVALLEQEAHRGPHWQPSGWMGTIARYLVVLGFFAVLAGAAHLLLAKGLDSSGLASQTPEGKAATDKWWVLSLVMMFAVWEVIVTDQYLPNMPEMRAELGASYAEMSATVVVLPLIRGVVAFPLGVISDRIGRRGIVLFFFGMLPVSSVACGLAPDIKWLLAARVLNGISEAVCSLAPSIVRDTIDNPEERAKAEAVLLSIGMVFPAFAPSVGGVLGVWIGWRSVFLLCALGMSVCWLMLFLHLPETLAVDPDIEDSYWEHAREIFNRKSMVLLTVGFVSSVVYYAMLSNGPLILEGVFGLTALQTALAMGVIAFSFTLGGILSDLVVQSYGILRAYRIGILVMTLPLGLFIASAVFPRAWWLFIGAQLLYSLLYLIVFVAGDVFYMQPFSKVAGLAAAVGQFSLYCLTNILVLVASVSLEKSTERSRTYALWAVACMFSAGVIATFGFAWRPPDYALEAQREFEESMAKNEAESIGDAAEKSAEPGKVETKPAAADLLTSR